jgi:hypothetical protein
MAQTTVVTVSPFYEIVSLELTVQQQEELLGPLVALGNDGAVTVLTFDIDQDPPQQKAVIRPASDDVSSNPSAFRLIGKGICFVSGRLMEIAAYRPL